MNIPAGDVPVGRFFATAEQPPGNVFIMRAHGKPGEPVRLDHDGRPHRLNGQFAGVPVRDDVSLAENIDDNTYWHVRNNLLVRLIREDEQDKTEFYV